MAGPRTGGGKHPGNQRLPPNGGSPATGPPPPKRPTPAGPRGRRRARGVRWGRPIRQAPGATGSGRTLNFNVGAPDPALFWVQPAVASNGDLSFTPATTKYGTTTVTVSITDNGGTANGGVDTSANQTFNINVHGPPTAHND